ncbi:MAG TPA: prephenate dehydrogenase [Myxococcota bacterium]|nr:prephenate dehydrogenase [Myxococcota bacterium]
MKPAIERLAVLGLGLLGGSLGLAARARGVARSVVGASRSREALARARARGVADLTYTDPREAVEGADLVILATPPFAMPGVVREIAPGLRPGALVSDVGSVKGMLAETLPGCLPPGVAFVGAHPMAGGHARGLDHARADLFEGAACVVAPGAGADPGSVERLCAFWEALGARVVLRDPAAHDAEVAWVSHLPHALAFAFARALAGAPPGAAELTGPGFRDFTRIAHGDPELWSEIFAANRKALAGPLQAVAARLAELARELEAGDADALERLLTEARGALAGFAARAAASDARSGGANPEIPAAAGGPEGSSRNTA